MRLFDQNNRPKRNSNAAQESDSLAQHQSIFFKLPSSVEYKIPKLTLLTEMVSAVKNSQMLPDLSNAMFIGVQHVLETTVTLFDSLKDLGVKYENMYFSGKCYSTALDIEYQVRKRSIHLMQGNKPEELGEYEKYCRKGIAKMWEYFIEDISNKKVDMIIILDEGGRCLEGMPEFIGFKYRVAAIEQTRAGLYSESVNLLPIPSVTSFPVHPKTIFAPAIISSTRPSL